MDPVYTGKAMAGLIDLVRKGYFERDSNLLCREIPANEKLSASGGCPWAFNLESALRRFFPTYQVCNTGFQ